MNLRKVIHTSWYIQWYYMLLLSFCLALYLNWPTQFLRIIDLLQMRIFWTALTFSMLLGFVLIWVLGLLCIWLDSQYPWKQQIWQRLAWQFLLGVASPLILILVLVRYTYFKDQTSFTESGYLILEFPVVVAAILALNFMYYGLSHQKKQKEIRLKSLVKGKFRSVSQEEIIILRRHKNSGSLLLKDGTEGRIDYLIEDLEKLLDAEKFVTINRSTIVAVDCIKGWVPVGNGQFLLELRYEVFKDAKLTVSRRRKRTLETLLTGQIQAIAF